MPTTQLATCTGCGERNENRRLIRPANGQNYWMGLCTTCERSRNRARRANGSTSVPRITAGRLGLNRKFGVEIECNVPRGTSGAAYGDIRTALAVNFPGWKARGDGSLGRHGIEIVSPPLSGTEGLAQLQRVLAMLEAKGATVDRSCGLHVHHEVQDIGKDGMVLFVRSWMANQDLIDFLVSPSRRNNQNRYCRRIGPAELTAIGSWSGSSASYPPGERYRTVNVHAFPKFGTVEVRQHQGTLSYRKIEAWIKLGQGLLDSVSGRRQAHGYQGNLRSLLQTAHVDEDTEAYFLGRAMQFGAPAEALGLGTAVAA